MKHKSETLFLTLEPSIYFQSKLNCEVLHDELAFEVRWAIAGESAVIQLVAKLGKVNEWKWKFDKKTSRIYIF